MLLYPESGPKLSGNGFTKNRDQPTHQHTPRNPGLKGLLGNGFTRTVTPHLRSIVPNVQRHMAYLTQLSAASDSTPPCILKTNWTSKPAHF